MTTLHENIRRCRAAADLTSEEAAERAGMHRVTWSDIERGKNTNPTIGTLKKMAAALGVAVTDFLEERRGLGSRCRKCGSNMVCTGAERLGPPQETLGGAPYRVRFEQYLCPECGYQEWGAVGTDEDTGD